MSNLNEQVKENRKKFRVDHFDMIISDYIQKKENDLLILDPPYQRLFRWNIETQSELIESILIGIPLPPIFVFQNDEAKWEIIDGVQRTQTLVNFLGKDSKQKFEGCKIITSLNNKEFSELPDNIQRIIGNSRIRIEIVEESDDIFSQYLLFNRLNGNGEKLEAQEIRNFLIYKINNEFYEKIQYLAKEKYFLETLSLKEHRIDKQENVEYVLKFFLGREFSKKNPNEESITSYDTIDELITKETEIFLKKHDLSYLLKEYEIFEKTFKNILNIFGGNSFRFFQKRLNNIANTFSLAVGLSFIIDDIESINKEKIIELARTYFDSDKYKTLTKSGYSPTKRIYELNQYSSNFFMGAIKNNG